MPPKYQRKSHTKSKLGCHNCKVRRIKCNEVHPTCQNCARREIVCDFARSSEGVSEDANPTASPNPPPSHRSRSDSSTTHSHGGGGGGGGGNSTHDDGDQHSSGNDARIDPLHTPNLVSTKKTTDLDVSDLQLMHHFTTTTAFDLAGKHAGDALVLWQQYAPNLGFKHDFLLRGILAVSALHQSHSAPHRKREFDLKASTHQSLALASYQEVLSHVDASNCHALFLFSCLIIVMAFASNTKDNASDFQTDVLFWFYLLRGCNEVLKMHHDILNTSFLKPLLDELNYTENHAAYAIPDAERITELFSVCRSTERETAQAYTLAIHSLLSTFIQASILKKRGEGMVLASFVWPVNLPPRFLDLLSEKQPEAMVILAHYCVLIHWGEVNGTWFMVGWARYMLDTIKALIPQEWHEHVSWPDSVVK